jgi:hypothetical protein
VYAHGGLSQMHLVIPCVMRGAASHWLGGWLLVCMLVTRVADVGQNMLACRLAATSCTCQFVLLNFTFCNQRMCSLSKRCLVAKVAPRIAAAM